MTAPSLLATSLPQHAPIVAGAICEGSSCDGLVLLLLGMLLAMALVVVALVLAWASVASALLHRRGWTPARRRITAMVSAVVGLLVVGKLAGAVPDVASVLFLVVALPPLPLTIAIRSRNRRQRNDGDAPSQSSPCSTA